MIPDWENVIKGFECCHVMVHDLGPDKTSCGICPYKDVQTEEQIDLGGIECIAALHDDALALLKEQEAVEPKTGRWIFESAYCEAWSHTCSECGKRMTTAYNTYANYCWNCGAKMEGW